MSSEPAPSEHIDAWRYVAAKIAPYPGTTQWVIQEFFPDIEGDPAWSEGPEIPVGSSLDGLRETLERMLAAIDKPVLDLTTRPPRLGDTELIASEQIGYQLHHPPKPPSHSSPKD